nr:hypothetical protein [Arthrobacter sp. TB 23]
MDDGVVEPVASEPVDFVDDAQLHRVCGDVVKHLLQRPPAGGLGRLAGLDELLDDDRTELFGFALGGFTLSGDGQTFFEAVACGLVLGRDPQIGDGGHRSVRPFLPDCGRLLAFVGSEGAERCEVDAGRKIGGSHRVTAFQVPNCQLGVWGAGWRSHQESKRTPLNEGLRISASDAVIVVLTSDSTAWL